MSSLLLLLVAAAAGALSALGAGPIRARWEQRRRPSPDEPVTPRVRTSASETPGCPPAGTDLRAWALAQLENATEERELNTLRTLGAVLSRVDVRSGLERSCQAGRWKLAAAWMNLFGPATDAEDAQVAARLLTALLDRLPPAAVSAYEQASRQLDAEFAYVGSWWDPLTDEPQERRDSRYRAVEARREELDEKYGVAVAAALAYALRNAPDDRGRQDALVKALGGPRDVRAAAAEGLVRDPDYLPLLWSLEELPGALATLGPAHGPAAERALMACLDHPSVAVVGAAVQALGAAGTIRAIPALRDCAERHRGNREVEYAVRQAIAEIQSRLPGASPGQLSIAGAESGQVSLVEEDQRGQVSLNKQ